MEIRVPEAAVIIAAATNKPISHSQVRRLCADGALKSRKECGDWFIAKESAETYERKRRTFVKSVEKTL